MEFRKYYSIENSYNKKFIDLIYEAGLQNAQYIVQEKVHGGNLSIWTNNGIDFKTAKRTAFLETEDKFYNHQEVLERLKNKFISIWDELKASRGVNQITIYGEILGGVYPHPEVLKNKSAVKVQKGVYYSPNNEFYAFDILLDNSTYLSSKEAIALFEKCELLHAKTIFRGSLEEVLNYSNTFQSVIPAQLGLPPIPNNTCEGVIIRSVDNLSLTNGRRLIIKNKNEEWEEREKSSKRRIKKPELSNETKVLQEEISLYVTENRLNNVISKIGTVSQSDFGKLMGLFSKDVVEDFSKDFADQLEGLEKKELKVITKSITKKMATILKQRL